MNTVTVSVTSADPEALASELAIATAGSPEPPSSVRVNGIHLDRLTTEADWPAAPCAWRLADDRRAWSMVVFSDDEWQVFDIFRCMDLAEQIEADSGVPDVFVTPLANGWVVTRADPERERELRLCVGAREAAIWRTRGSALAAARRHAQAMAAQSAAG